MVKGGREGYEVSEKAVMDDFTQFDVCVHGNYPGEADCGCTFPAGPDALILKWKRQKGEYADIE